MCQRVLGGVQRVSGCSSSDSTPETPDTLHERLRAVREERASARASPGTSRETITPAPADRTNMSQPAAGVKSARSSLSFDDDQARQQQGAAARRHAVPPRRLREEPGRAVEVPRAAAARAARARDLSNERSQTSWVRRVGSARAPRLSPACQIECRSRVRARAGQSKVHKKLGWVGVESPRG